MKTNVQKWGNSLALRIPKSFAVECGLGEGSEVDLAVRDGGLVVEPLTEREYTLEELVAGITKKNRHDAADFGGAVGKEAL